MKKQSIAIFIFTFLFFISTAYSQIINWNTPSDKRHIISAGFGWDYSVSISAGYSYRLNTKKPLLLSTNVSIPGGKIFLDDFKTQLGGQLLLLKRTEFIGSISWYGIYRRYETRLVRIQNFGSSLKGVFGYYKTRFFVAVEAGFDKAIVSNLKHSPIYKDEIYEDVVDGWYGPATGGNFLYGLQTGCSLKKFDVALNLGKVLTQDFKTTPFVPYYINFGFNYKL